MKTITLNIRNTKKDWIKTNLASILNPTPEFKNSVTEWPQKYSCNFIEPGLISYEDQGLGKCFVSKETLDKMAASFVGKPVVHTRNHVDGMKPEDFERVSDGVITNVYYKPEDGWYWADFILWDDEVKNQIEKEGFSVSCAYTVKEATGTGGIRNNIKFDQEVLDGEYTHLAIVPNPRYNGARIILNSLQGGSMKVKAWLKRLGADFKNAISADGSSIDVDGLKIPVQDIISEYEAEEKETAEKAKKEEADKAEAAKATPAKEEELGEDSTLTIGDKEVTIKDAINCYRNRKSRKNMTDEEMAKKKADDDAEAKKKEATDAEEKKNQDDAEQKKKDDEKKAADDKAAEDKKEEEKKNSLEAKEKEKKFLELKNTATNRTEKAMPPCVEDKRAKGKELYGSKTGGN